MSKERLTTLRDYFTYIENNSRGMRPNLRFRSPVQINQQGTNTYTLPRKEENGTLNVLPDGAESHVSLMLNQHLDDRIVTE